MSIQQPSQFKCNEMEPGDVIFVKHRSLLYKLIRHYFYNDKTKITVRKDWNNPPQFVTYYQEDCVLMYSYELKCIQSLNNEVPCILGYGKNNKPLNVFKIHRVDVSLYNIQIVFKHNIVLTIPVDKIYTAIKRNEGMLKNIEDERLLKENIKFLKYKGDYFKEYIKTNDIKKWTPQYCTICGKSVTFNFKRDKIDLVNNCKCGNLDINIKQMNYDEFALWFAGQVNPMVKKHYNEFWFKER